MLNQRKILTIKNGEFQGNSLKQKLFKGKGRKAPWKLSV